MEPRVEFTEEARNVLAYAQEEATRLHHGDIGSEHLLLGLLRAETGIAAQILINMGVDLQKVRSAVETIIGRGDQRIEIGEQDLTPRAKTIVGLAVVEVGYLRSSHLGTEHLLLGLLREGESIALYIIESLGADRYELRVRVLERLAYHPPS